MKFSKEVPEEAGWYWTLHKVYADHERFTSEKMARLASITCHHGIGGIKNHLWGSRIPEPESVEVES